MQVSLNKKSDGTYTIAVSDEESQQILDLDKKALVDIYFEIYYKIIKQS